MDAGHEWRDLVDGQERLSRQCFKICRNTLPTAEPRASDDGTVAWGATRRPRVGL